MGRVVMILRKVPYGDINAAEAVRHAMGGAADELDIDLVLVDGGVLIAKKGQDETGTGFTNLEAVIKDCIDLGVAVYADGQSLKDQHLEPGDITEGVRIADRTGIADIVASGKSTMIF